MKTFLLIASLLVLLSQNCDAAILSSIPYPVTTYGSIVVADIGWDAVTNANYPITQPMELHDLLFEGEIISSSRYTTYGDLVATLWYSPELIMYNSTDGWCSNIVVTSSSSNDGQSILWSAKEVVYSCVPAPAVTQNLNNNSALFQQLFDASNTIKSDDKNYLMGLSGISSAFLVMLIWSRGL
jgi:hypothetical protein